MCDLPGAVGHPLLTDASIHHEDAGWTDYGASCFGTEKRRSKRWVWQDEDGFCVIESSGRGFACTRRALTRRLFLVRRRTQSRTSFETRGGFGLAARLCEPTEGRNMQSLIETMEFSLGQGDSSRPPQQGKAHALAGLSNTAKKQVFILDEVSKRDSLSASEGRTVSRDGIRQNFSQLDLLGQDNSSDSLKPEFAQTLEVF